MTVTITGTVVDVTGRKDSREWRAWSPVYRAGTDGAVVTYREQDVQVVAGALTAKLEPGPCFIQNPDGQRWLVTVPDEDTELWPLIELAVALPPDTPADVLTAAVTAYFEAHPVDAGPPGPANSLSIGTVTTGTAAATITGDAPDQTLNLVLPEGEDGHDGPSAYDVAVANGFVGDQTAWLASLKGDPGDPGADGDLTETGLVTLVDDDGSDIRGALDGLYAASAGMSAAVYDPGHVAGDAFAMDNMVDGTTNRVFTTAEKSKLSGVEAGADVTDATNVDAAGAVMNTDTTTAAMGFVVDEDDMASDSATKVPTQQSVKAHVAAAIAALIGAAPAELDTWIELVSAIEENQDAIAGIVATVATKADDSAVVHTADVGSTVQAHDADLDAVAGLSPSNDDVLQRKSGTWVNRTPAQLKTDLALAKADVGLGSVDNTADSAKAVASAGKLTAARKINGVSTDLSADVILPPQTVSVTNIGNPSIAITGPYAVLNDTALNGAVSGVTVTAASGVTIGDGWRLLLRFKDNGTSRAITLGSSFQANGVTIPTATTAGKWLTLGCIYNAVDSKFDVVAVGVQA